MEAMTIKSFEFVAENLGQIDEQDFILHIKNHMEANRAVTMDGIRVKEALLVECGLDNRKKSSVVLLRTDSSPTPYLKITKIIQCS